MEYNLAKVGGLMFGEKPSGFKSWLFNYSHPISRKLSDIRIVTYPGKWRYISEAFYPGYQRFLTSKVHLEADKREDFSQSALGVYGVYRLGMFGN